MKSLHWIVVCFAAFGAGAGDTCDVRVKALAESGASFVPMLPGMPTIMPDDETDGRHFVSV